uniref:Uncharacterized protein n=1 Tax=Anguilla anguilla TaxID=7936 RepID=A0A0E9SQD2_ANGAN
MTSHIAVRELINYTLLFMFAVYDLLALSECACI